MKKLLAAMAAVMLATTLTFASAEKAEARHGGRWVAGLALGLAGAAILSHSYRDRYYYGYYPSRYSYDDYYYYPRRHWRHHRWHRHHRHHW